MAYSAEISRTHPSCFLLLVDQSGSMSDGFGGAKSGKSKAECVADATNRLLQNLVIKCAKEEGIRDYYHVGVIGYGSAGIAPALAGPLAGKELVAVSEIGTSPARVEQRARKVDDGAGGLVEQQVRFPIWLDAAAKGGTPMLEALGLAHGILSRWLAEHPSSFPPVVINITDGESTDGDPMEAASRLQSLSTSDGNVLLFNLHLSSSAALPVEFPSDEALLPDKFASLLFRMSSELPDHMRDIALQEGKKVEGHARGFSFNADLVSVIQFLDIGTRPAELR
ncbi:MAG: VWA domain-containing protein [Candidatus Wallbacteria bacterium]|nr:VWA domain-containing protein [Candidatus Wallbacteria bacterium]